MPDIIMRRLMHFRVFYAEYHLDTMSKAVNLEDEIETARQCFHAVNKSAAEGRKCKSLSLQYRA